MMKSDHDFGAVAGIMSKLAEPEARSFHPRPASGKNIWIRPGVSLKRSFPDPEGLLDTAYKELDTVLDGWGIQRLPNTYEMRFECDSSLEQEEFELKISESGCCLSAADIEGIRRGLYELSGRLYHAGGAWLTPDHQKKKMFVRNRISRSYYGPTHRAVQTSDELMDEIDYYPEPYLNHLAREGINILWLSVFFSEVTWSSIMKPDPDCPRRLEKLRAVVAKCRRYGIRVFVFCIEPRGFRGMSDLLKKHPSLQGVDWGWNLHGFCPSSETAQRHLYEQTFHLFQSVPGLGGIMDITHGESLSSCFHMPQPGATCPRCSQLPPEEILRRVLVPMMNGMRKAAPDTEFISWFYRSHAMKNEPEWIFRCAEAVPKDVIILYNFESGLSLRQQGTMQQGGDYWQSKAGPSARFRQMARRLKKSGGRFAAKLQVSNGHELATVPVIPVPGIFYRKYKFLKKMKIDTVMYSWYFGCFPGLMNQAVQQLSYSDFSQSEDEFLLKFAESLWGREYAEDVAEAWKFFDRGFGCYPLNTAVQYHGPFHDGIAWPLFFEVCLNDLPPTWRRVQSSGGDAIGKCLCGFTLKQMEKQSGRMARTFNKGLKILLPLAPYFKNNPERSADIEYAEAVGLLLNSGWHIFKFYLLRRELYKTGDLSVLARMTTIIQSEIINTGRMITLCENNLLIGYHSEAESYKFAPQSLRERIRSLERILLREIPLFRKSLKNGIPPKLPSGKKENIYRADGSLVRQNTFEWSMQRRISGGVELRFEGSYPPGTPNAMSDKLYLHINDAFYSEYPKIIEFSYHAVNSSIYYYVPTEYSSVAEEKCWRVSCILPEEFFDPPEGLLFNIFRCYECDGKTVVDSWVSDPGEPATGSSFKTMKAAALGKIILLPASAESLRNYS